MMLFEKDNRAISKREKRQSAFTLIELVIVIGITVVLFSLLLIPLISAINNTRQAQALIAAQDAARVTLEVVSRELGSAVYVFDGTSHSFKTSNTPVMGDDRYTNFLDLAVTDKNGAQVIEHAYNAKLDMVQPKRTGTDIDPTTGDTFKLRATNNGAGSAFITDPALVFPTAPGTTMIRYWVGLKDPTRPYNNLHEGKPVANDNDNNTYVLYRAQFQPYNSNGSVNRALFALSPTGKPELDDPDFFRYVNLNGATDVNWLDDVPNRSNYPNQKPINSAPDGMADDHNNRVENWYKIAKQVIPGPNVDLILLPHTTDGTPAYDAGAPGVCSATACPGVAHSGVAHDPVSGLYYPVVATSVTFRPGTISGAASPQTTTEYNSAGVPANGVDTIPYIPTVYAANSQSWAQPYTVTITSPPGASPATYTTGLDAATGDVVEYKDGGTTPVYDITTGTPQGIAGNFVPLSINADSGTINFSVPALHLFTDSSATGASSQGATSLSVPASIDNFNRDWLYTPKAAGSHYQVNLTDDSTVGGTQYAPPLGHITNARIVAGSLRVYGPDSTPGPNLGQMVLYTQIFAPPADNTATDNQYLRDFAVDPTGNTLTFYGNQDQFSNASPPQVRVLYDYQANMAAVSGTLTPMNVKVDYRTRDLIDVAIGVRIYDVSSGVAQVIPAESKVKIGNSAH